MSGTSRAIIAGLLLVVGYSGFRIVEDVRARTGDPEEPSTQSNVLGLEVFAATLGRIPTHAEVERTITVRNPTPRAIQIDSLLASCSCTSVDPIAFNLAPGASQDVRLLIAAKQYRGHGDSRFEQTVTLQSHHGTAECQFVSLAYDAIRVPAQPISFLEPIRLGDRPVSNVAVVQIAPEVTEVDVTVPGDAGRIIDRSEREVDGTREVSFRVELSPVESVNQVTVPVKLQASVAETDPAVMSWLCTGTVDSDVNYWPTSLAVVGGANASGGSSVTARVWSKSGLSLDDLTVEIGGLPIETSVTVSRAGRTVVHVSPLSDDVRPGSTCYDNLTIHGQSPRDDRPFTIRIAVSVTNVAAAIVLNTDRGQ